MRRSNDVELVDIKYESSCKRIFKRGVTGSLHGAVLLKGGAEVATFPLLATSSLKEQILLHTPAHFVLFPAIAIGLLAMAILDVKDLVVASRRRPNDKSIESKYILNAVTSVIAAMAAGVGVVGGIVAATLFAPIAPWLFVGAMTVMLVRFAIHYRRNNAELKRIQKDLGTLIVNNWNIDHESNADNVKRIKDEYNIPATPAQVRLIQC